MKVSFDPDILRELLCDSKNGQVSPDTITDPGRWPAQHKLIFAYCGKLYQTSCTEESTKYQDELP